MWNKDKCQCECAEDLISKLNCDRGYVWNPSTCECECDKFCGVGQYLDYENCTCQKCLINNLVEECVRVVDEDIEISLVRVDDCPPRVPHIMLFVAFLILFVVIFSGMIYYWRKHNRNVVEKRIYDVTYSNTGVLNY